MGRKKKLINNTDIPQYAIERFARCVFDDIRADFAREDVQAEFALWMAERENKKGAAKTAALSVYIAFFLRGPLGLDSGRIGKPFAKYFCSYLVK